MRRQGPIPFFFHGLLEYGAAILFIAAPFLFGFDSDAATAVSIVVGVAVLAVAASTDGPTGLSKLIPIGVHAAFDLALAIFLIAGAVAAGISTLATRVMGETPLGKVVATAAPILVMTIATFMILDQLMIAESIVTITYAGLIGAIALGSALAFGLGGRDVARRALETAGEKGTEGREQYRHDLDTGMTRADDDSRVIVPAGADTEPASRRPTDTY